MKTAPLRKERCCFCVKREKMPHPRRSVSLPCVGGGGSPLGLTEGVYGWMLQKCADPSEECLPLGEGGPAQAGPDEGRDALSILRVGAAACPARSNFIRQTGEALAFPWRGRCHGLRSVTDEVEGCSVVPTYGDDWQLRPHPSALAGCQLPLHAGSLFLCPGEPLRRFLLLW